MCSNGIRYENARVASRALNVSNSHIIQICKKRRKTTGGLTFYYENEVPPTPQTYEQRRAAAQRYHAKPESKIKRNATRRTYSKNNPELIKSIALKNSYGITLEEALGLLASQGGLCAICNEVPVPFGKRKYGWSVDHCHKTNKIRGVLCNRCNFMLGHARDNPEILKAGVEYLKSTT